MAAVAVGLLLGIYGPCLAADELAAGTGRASVNKEDAVSIKSKTDTGAPQTDKAVTNGGSSNGKGELKPANIGPTWENSLRFKKLKIDDEDVAAAHPVRRKSKTALYGSFKW